MTARVVFVAVLSTLLAFAAGAGQEGEEPPQSQPAPSQPAGTAPPEEAAPEEGGEPDHIKVQHVLISFTGKLPGGNVTRTMDEARLLAYEILERARGGEDFDELVREYSDDKFPGIYSMANHGVRPRPGEYQRSGMVAAFGDAGFPLEVGGIGIADFHPQKSPYGWHIVKRLE